MAAPRSVGEGSTFPVRIRVYDANNALTTPQSLKYRIDCETTGETIRDWTPVAALSDQTVTVTAADNRIVDDENRKEKRSLVVVIDDDLDTQFVPAAPYQWEVTNVARGKKVTT